MKKFLSILFILVLVLTLGLVTAVPVSAATDVWVATTGDDSNPGTVAEPFLTIQKGIDAVDLGGTVNVAQGTYTESIVIDKSLMLLGAGWETTVIVGAHIITASGVTVDGFKLDGGITINDAANPINGGTISNNFITGARYGIRVGFTDGLGVDGITIEDNVITLNTSKGIISYDAKEQAPHLITNITISGNEITLNGSSGISTYGSGPFIIINNIVSGNTGNGISIKYDDGDVVTGNTVANNGDMGINMHQVTNTVVESNTVSGHLNEGVVTTFWGDILDVGKGSGIYIHEFSLGNTIRYNSITGNNNGVLINSEGGDLPSGNSITYNSIVGNIYYGVLNVTPSLVDATSNWWGTDVEVEIVGMVSGNVLYEPWLAYEVGSTTGSDLDLIAKYSVAPLQIGILVEPALVNFGDVEPGMPSATQTVTVTNTGNVVEDFSATIENELPAGVYTGTPGLTMNGSSVAAWLPTGVDPDGTEVPSLVLTVPTGTAPGTYKATLVFWAEAAQ